MDYRCLTCGFSQDFEPTPESVSKHHPWMAGLPINQCPACTKYINTHGGRKHGKVRMPDISVPGSIVEKSTVQEQFDELSSAFRDATERAMLPQEKALLKGKHAKIFGWTVDELQELRAKN